MSIKLLDTDCAINLTEKMRSFDCIPFLSNYKTIITDHVFNELKRGISFKNLPFEIYKLSNEETELFYDTADYLSKLGTGERSTMIHALFLSNKYSCENKNKVVVLCNDKEANHIFQNVLPKDPMMRHLFPNR